MPDITVKLDITDAVNRISKYELGKLNQTRTALKEAAIGTERGAKKIVPVDTGRLRSSIRILHARTDQLGFEVGTDVEYAFDVESRVPYLNPAFQEAKAELILKLEKILRK